MSNDANDLSSATDSSVATTGLESSESMYKGDSEEADRYHSPEHLKDAVEAPALADTLTSEPATKDASNSNAETTDKGTLEDNSLIEQGANEFNSAARAKAKAAIQQ